MVGFTMAVAVLLQFGFVSINSMTCLNSGNQVVSVGELDDCCAAESTTETSFAAKCCKFEVSSKAFHVYKNVDGPSIEIAALPAVFESATECIPFTKTILNTTWLANPPPILDGFNLLVFISKFSL